MWGASDLRIERSTGRVVGAQRSVKQRSCVPTPKATRSVSTANRRGLGCGDSVNDSCLGWEKNSLPPPGRFFCARRSSRAPQPAGGWGGHGGLTPRRPIGRNTCEHTWRLSFERAGFINNTPGLGRLLLALFAKGAFDGEGDSLVVDLCYDSGVIRGRSLVVFCGFRIRPA